MIKSYLLGTSVALMVLTRAAAQSDKSKETNDYLIMRTPTPTPEPADATTIHQEVSFNASPQRVYEALLDAKQFTAFSDRPAEINREVGGTFSLFAGHSIGRTLELILTK